MKVLISWSGEQAKAIAVVLRTWLPSVLQFIDPWMSVHDIQAGTRWSHELAKELQGTRFGILVVTAANKSSTWMHFEAGALAKSVDEARVIPYLIDLELSSLDRPLSDFQAKKAEKAATLELLRPINSCSEVPVKDEVLMSIFDAMWPRLEEAIKSTPNIDQKRPPRKPTETILEELVASVRALSQDMDMLRMTVRRIERPTMRQYNELLNYWRRGSTPDEQRTTEISAGEQVDKIFEFVRLASESNNPADAKSLAIALKIITRLDPKELSELSSEQLDKFRFIVKQLTSRSVIDGQSSADVS